MMNRLRMAGSLRASLTAAEVTRAMQEEEENRSERITQISEIRPLEKYPRLSNLRIRELRSLKKKIECLRRVGSGVPKEKAEKKNRVEELQAENTKYRLFFLFFFSPCHNYKFVDKRGTKLRMELVGR